MVLSAKYGRTQRVKSTCLWLLGESTESTEIGEKSAECTEMATNTGNDQNNPQGF